MSPLSSPADRSAIGWRLWVDTGGTFTDCLGIDPAGRLRRAKVLSNSSLRGELAVAPDGTRVALRGLGGEGAGWALGFFVGYRLRLLGRSGPGRLVVADSGAGGFLTIEAPFEEGDGAMAGVGTPCEILSPEEAPLLAARLLTRASLSSPLPVAEMRLATTRGTNALLERHGAPTVLFITRGFGDLLAIGTQQRPDLFALDIRKPAPLYDAVVEVEERLDATGRVLRPLDLAAAEAAARPLRERGIRSAAVALMHSYLEPAHERLLGARLRELGFDYVAISSELAPFIQLLPRARTAVADAYLGPIVAAYLAGVAKSLGGEGGGAALRVMTSAGGLASAEAFRPKDSLLSGPAGGVVGAARSGERLGRRRLITFDMGGTSTDVARYDGDFDYVYEHTVGDARLLAPALAIETVAAGGGSICRFDGERLRVGPESAGAQPGPACYGSGGPLTTTDVNLLLGRLDPARFGIPVEVVAAERCFQQLCAELKVVGYGIEDSATLLEGFLRIANERMADAIRRVSVRRGYDPAEYSLLAFGGAGGQHACAVAAQLGMREAIVPPDAGLLSAFGLGQALLERFAERQVLRPLGEALATLEAEIESLLGEARAALSADGVAPAAMTTRRRTAHLRFAGQDATVEVEIDAPERLRADFERRYEEIFGHRPEARDIELESLRVVVASRPSEPPVYPPMPPAYHPEPERRLEARFSGARHDTPVFAREALRPGAALAGPALIAEDHCTTVVEPGWGAAIAGDGAIVLTRE